MNAAAKITDLTRDDAASLDFGGIWRLVADEWQEFGRRLAWPFCASFKRRVN